MEEGFAQVGHIKEGNQDFADLTKFVADDQSRYRKPLHDHISEKER